MIPDTSAWIEYLRATGSEVYRCMKRAIESRQPVYLLPVVYQEVLQGAAGLPQFIRLQDLLDNAHFWSPHDAYETAREAALLYARCRWQGITIRSPNDCLIAACAIEAGLPLLHADHDFGHIASIEPRLQLLP